jgi:hypothetical protein
MRNRTWDSGQNSLLGLILGKRCRSDKKSTLPLEKIVIISKSDFVFTKRGKTAFLANQASW